MFEALGFDGNMAGGPLCLACGEQRKLLLPWFLIYNHFYKSGEILIKRNGTQGVFLVVTIPSSWVALFL